MTIPTMESLQLVSEPTILGPCSVAMPYLWTGMEQSFTPIETQQLLWTGMEQSFVPMEPQQLQDPYSFQFERSNPTFPFHQPNHPNFNPTPFGLEYYNGNLSFHPNIYGFECISTTTTVSQNSGLTTFSLPSRWSKHNRVAAGGKRKAWRKKYKYALGCHPKLSSCKTVRRVRTRGNNGEMETNLSVPIKLQKEDQSCLVEGNGDIADYMFDKISLRDVIKVTDKQGEDIVEMELLEIEELIAANSCHEGLDISEDQMFEECLLKNDNGLIAAVQSIETEIKEEGKYVEDQLFDKSPQRVVDVSYEVLVSDCDIWNEYSILNDNGEWERIYGLICNDYEAHLVDIKDDGEVQEDEKLGTLNKNNMVNSGANYFEFLEDVLYISLDRKTQPDSRFAFDAMSHERFVTVDNLGASLESITNKVSIVDFMNSNSYPHSTYAWDLMNIMCVNNENDFGANWEVMEVLLFVSNSVVKFSHLVREFSYGGAHEGMIFQLVSPYENLQALKKLIATLDGFNGYQFYSDKEGIVVADEQYDEMLIQPNMTFKKHEAAVIEISLVMITYRKFMKREGVISCSIVEAIREHSYSIGEYFVKVNFQIWENRNRGPSLNICNACVTIDALNGKSLQFESTKTPVHYDVAKVFEHGCLFFSCHLFVETHPTAGFIGEGNYLLALNITRTHGINIFIFLSSRSELGGLIQIIFVTLGAMLDSRGSIHELSLKACVVDKTTLPAATVKILASTWPNTLMQEEELDEYDTKWILAKAGGECYFECNFNVLEKFTLTTFLFISCRSTRDDTSQIDNTDESVNFHTAMKLRTLGTNQDQVLRMMTDTDNTNRSWTFSQHEFIGQLSLEVIIKVFAALAIFSLYYDFIKEEFWKYKLKKLHMDTKLKVPAEVNEEIYYSEAMEYSNLWEGTLVAAMYYQNYVSSSFSISTLRTTPILRSVECNNLEILIILIEYVLGFSIGLGVFQTWATYILVLVLYFTKA